MVLKRILLVRLVELENQTTLKKRNERFSVFCKSNNHRMICQGIVSGKLVKMIV